MRFKPDQHRPRTGPPDITAMVDVVFLLIVFFLTTITLTQVVRDRSVELAKLQGEADESPPAPSVVINLNEDGRFEIEGDTLSLAAVVQMVRADAGRSDSLDVLVRPDQRAPVRALNELARGLIEAGVREWRLSVDPVGAGGAP